MFIIHQAHRLSLLLASFTMLFPAFASAAPPTMSAMSAEELKAHTAQSEGFTIVWFTADWCGPCGLMESGAWSDDEVSELIDKGDLTVVMIDTDEHPELVGRFTIASIPTTIMLENGGEINRFVGVKDKDELVQWLNNLQEARRIRDEAAKRHEKAEAEKVNSNGHDIDARLKSARALIQEGSYEQATNEFLWLWDNMLQYDASKRGVRISFMASDMEELAENYLGAQKAFTLLRDRVDEEYQAKKGDRDLFRDWLVLNIKILHDDEPIKKWMDGMEADPERAALELRPVSYLVDGYLLEHKEWALLGYALPDAQKIIQTARYGMDHMPDFGNDERMKALSVEHGQKYYTKNMLASHAAFLAAGRDAEAWKLTDDLFETLNTPDTQNLLLEMVLDSEQVRPEHLKLAPKADQNLARKCRSFLARQELNEN